MEELDILNAMLAAVGSNGVSSTVGRHPALMKAQPILERINKQVQTVGHWFNTDQGLTLTPSGVGEFIVPQNTLRCDTTVKRLPYVRRGRRMYDPTKQTYVLDVATLDVDVVIQLAYDMLPFVASDVIRAHAVLAMLANAEADNLSVGLARQDVQRAELAFNREKRGQTDTNLRDNPDYAYIMSGLPRRAGTSRNAARIGG